ncbi:MAG TPA: AAA family ATPase [Actinoplanes sp.]|nr:AAA family ATPase [Actinoplanes sp.]
MLISELRNPYDYDNAVRRPELFAGRGNELDDLRYALGQGGVDSPVEYIAVHGERGAGKTSLLNMCQLLAEDRDYLVVRVDLIPGDASARTFFAKLYERLIEAASRVGGLTAGDGSAITPRLIRRIASGSAQDDTFPLEFPESLAQSTESDKISEIALHADLSYILDKVGRPVAVLIDESQLIGDRMDVLSILRTLGNHLRGYVFVLAGTADLIERVQAVFGQLLRQFRYISVSRFTEIADVQDCVAKPLTTVGLVPEECASNLYTMADDLFRLTDGSPYEILFYCHTMFRRWQKGVANGLELSSETLDDVRTALVAGRDVNQRPLITAVRRMPEEELKALNILCSGLGRATVDELWLAHVLAGGPTMTRDDLDRYLAGFVAGGIIEQENSKISLTGEMFDQIYVRLWAFKKLDFGPHFHTQLINTLVVSHLLARNLEYFLCGLSQSTPTWVVRTCCFGMKPQVLSAGIEQFELLPPDTTPHYTVPFLFNALMSCGSPAALDITTVRCSFNGTTAYRWICSADSEDFELSSHPAFIEAVGAMAVLGGELTAERLRLPTRPWPEIVAWLTANGDQNMRRELSSAHTNASYHYYAQGDVARSLEHLTTATELWPTWHSANNLAYLSLNTGKNQEALDRATEALRHASTPYERALSAYNAALALLRLDDVAAARARLDEATAPLAVPMADLWTCSYLLVPHLHDGGIAMREEEQVNLKEAVSRAVELIEVTERYQRLHGS